MNIADLAASAVKGITRTNSAFLKVRREAPELSPPDVRKIDGTRWELGFAQCDITPDDVFSKKTWIAGFGIGRRMEGVHDPMTARAVWLGTENGGYLHIYFDAIGFTNTEVCVVRERLASLSFAANCLGVHISCTLTHAGIDTVGYWGKLPRTGKDPELMERIFSRAAAIGFRA
nr:hypothetical protein [Clostridia bacterium]